MSPQKMAETRKALFLLGFSLLSISRFGRATNSFLVGWALPTTACREGRRTVSIAIVKSSINSLLTFCSYIGFSFQNSK